MTLPTFVISPVLTVTRWASQAGRRVQGRAHRAYFTSPGAPAGEFFFIKVTNKSPKRGVVVSHTWVTSLDKFTDDVQIVNPERPLPARLRLDDQYETWIPVDEVPESDLGAEWRFRAKLTVSDKVIKSRPNKNVPPSGYVAGGGETPYAAPLSPETPPVTGAGPDAWKRVEPGQSNDQRFSDIHAAAGGRRRALIHTLLHDLLASPAAEGIDCWHLSATMPRR
jgi:hypothetical protein